MKRVALIVLGVVGVLIVGLLVAILMQPATLHVERSHVVAATPADVWPYVSDHRAFLEWDPWSEMDPDQVVEFSDPSSGVGAWYTWKGNEDVGSGKMTFTAVEPEKRVVQDLEFIEPYASMAVATTTLEAVEGGTEVTWGFESDNDFMGKAVSLFMDMDAMIGPDFEKGLAQLGALAEADVATRMAAEEEQKAAAEAEAAATAEDAPGTEAPQ